MVFEKVSERRVGIFELTVKAKSNRHRGGTGEHDADEYEMVGDDVEFKWSLWGSNARGERLWFDFDGRIAHEWFPLDICSKDAAFTEMTKDMDLLTLSPSRDYAHDQLIDALRACELRLHSLYVSILCMRLLTFVQTVDRTQRCALAEESPGRTPNESDFHIV